MSYNKVARVTDTISTGHGCDTVSTIKGHAEKCFAEGLAIARKGDVITTHNVPSGKKCVPHVVNIKVGSAHVFVEGKEIARKDDAVDNDKITGSATKVFAGD